ncbi:hypothetical protein NL676_000021 [Syzygium grande]|nr:hypothetical protein NL676_000021 [Syzygium grande]
MSGADGATGQGPVTSGGQGGLTGSWAGWWGGCERDTGDASRGEGASAMICRAGEARRARSRRRRTRVGWARVGWASKTRSESGGDKSRQFATDFECP